MPLVVEDASTTLTLWLLLTTPLIATTESTYFLTAFAVGYFTSESPSTTSCVLLFVRVSLTFILFDKEAVSTLLNFVLILVDKEVVSNSSDRFA